MSESTFETMPLDDLWRLHEEVMSNLASKLEVQKQEIERRLVELASNHGSADNNPQRRPYPKVRPKFQNPQEPSKTWSGRGKQPRWFGQLLDAGKSLDELRIPEIA
jgi:DNA-binding protein H-NS